MDEGIGITPEDQRRLFTTFHRVRSPETAAISGTGLGLYIVKSLVEIMGGTVRLISEPNRGTTVSVSLPAVSGVGSSHPPELGIGSGLPAGGEGLIGRGQQGSAVPAA